MAAKKDTDPVNAQVEKNMKPETDNGFRGVEVDLTPNENYTVAGVLAGKPTPETDAKAAAKAFNPEATA